MGRLELPGYENLTDAQKRIYHEIASSPRGEVRGPLAVWLIRPDLAHNAQKLGQYARYETILPPRLSELAILLTARIWTSEFEWWAHKKMAERAGISKAIIESIRMGKRPVYRAMDEKIVHDFSVRLHRCRKVDDETYGGAVEVLGQEGVVDLVGILGYYTLVSMTINVFDVAIPIGEKAELSEYSVDDAFYAIGNQV